MSSVTQNMVWVTKFAELRQKHPHADLMELIWATDEATREQPIEERLQAGIERSEKRQAANSAILTDAQQQQIEGIEIPSYH